MMDSNMKVVVIGALPADRVAPSRSYLVVNGERVSYAHLVYYRGGALPDTMRRAFPNSHSRTGWRRYG